MIVSDQTNSRQIMLSLLSAGEHMDEWQIVNINIHRNSQLSQDQLIKRLMRTYGMRDGFIHAVSYTKMIMVIRLGAIQNYAQMKKKIETEIPRQCGYILLRKMSITNMRQIQSHLMQASTNYGDDETIEESMYELRLKRRQNIILVADDDAFIRGAMKKLLISAGSFIEASDSSKVIAQYVNYNPDILILDIHMPGKNGIELIKDIIQLDPEAFIIILSADSSAENVIRALEEGAVGFLSKPPAKKKVQDYLEQCPTLNSLSASTSVHA